MDYKLILNNCKESIVKDIRGDIFELFKNRNFISEDQFDLINNNDPQMRNEHFFEILLGIVDQNVFKAFLSMLEENYWWLARSLSQQAEMNGSRRVIAEEVSTNSDPLHRQERERKQSAEVLRRGGTPLHQLSKLCVYRQKMSHELKEKIKELKPGMFLVFHGMSGSGKSSLAMEVLMDYDLVFNHLQGNVFWISELKTIEQIHRRLLGLMSDGAHFHEEFDSIIYQTQISRIIKQNKLEGALIVFDGVVSNEFIKYLDFNCKKLIITHDENIVSSNRSNEVLSLKMDNSLTEKEALLLFSNASGTDVSKLPEEALEIRRLTQGFPFLLHFIARQIQKNKEALKNGLWKKFTKILRRERRGNEVGSLNDFCLNELYNVFDSYLEELTKEMQRCYEMLAVFPNDVNLRAEVFTTIWTTDETIAIAILDEFENKSLIGKSVNVYNKEYVYGIHDVLSFYLKNRKNDHMKDLHNELIDKYAAKCGGELWKLEKDNYIHFYLGYHLKNAERYDLFSQFVNLQFVSAKIKAVGASDLLNDYEKYKEHIATQDNKKIFEELIEFIKYYGHVLEQSEDLNIVQLGLQQNESSAIYKAARVLAQNQHDKIFLNFQPKHRLVEDDNSDSWSSRIPKNVNTACFSDQFKYAFLANSDGSIIKKCLESKSKNVPLSGHKTSVLHLTVSPNKRYLLSVSEDLEFRVWDLLEVNNDRRFSSNGTLKNGDHSPSPPLRQLDHSPVFGSGPANVYCDCIAQAAQYHRAPLTCLKFSPNSEYILSCSENNRLAMWNSERNGITKQLILMNRWSVRVASVPRCCTFSLDGESVLVGCDNGTLVSMSTDLGIKKKTFHLDAPKFQAIRCLHTVEGVNGTHPPLEDHSNFVLVRSNKVEVIRIRNSYLRESGPEFASDQNYEVLCSWTFEKSEESLKTRSWVPENGAFIALTTSKHQVSLFNLANGHLQRNYSYESTQNVLSIDLFMEEKNRYMLVLCENEKLHKEKLELSPNEQASKFCVARYWNDEEEPTIVVPCLNGFKVVKGIQRQLDLNTNVTACYIDSSATWVAIGTACGTVSLFNLNTDEKKQILEFKDCNQNPSLVVLVRVYVIGNENLVVGIDNKHLVKISFKANVIEYQARSKVKWVWYSSDLKELIFVGVDHEIKIWKLSNMLETISDESDNGVDNEAHNSVHEKSSVVRCCGISSKNYLAIGTSRMITIVHLVANRNVNKISFNQSLNCCGFSPDGLFIALGFEDGKIQVYNAESLQLIRETDVKTSVTSVCIGEGAKVIGALSSRRIYLARLYNDSYRVGCTQLAAKQLIKAPHHDCFLTVDKKSQIYKVTIFNSIDFSEPFAALNINPRPSSRPRLIIKKKPYLFE